MSANTPNTSHQFLSGGGEMGALMRAKDWSTTLVGDISTWPQSLKTTLSIILNSKFPMFVFWGPQQICFFNDAYRPSLGADGRSHMLGEKGEDFWPDIWHVLKPQIDQVLAGGEATWYEDQLLPIFRNGKMETAYWTYSYSPVNDETNLPAGVFVTVTETTKQVMALQAIQEQEDQLKFTLDAAELATWDLNPITNKFIGNERIKEWFGLPPLEEIDLPDAINAIKESDRQRAADAIVAAMTYENGGNYEIEYTIVNKITGQERIVFAKGKALFGADKQPYRFSGILQDITLGKRIEQALQHSEKRFRDMVEQAPVGITILRGHDMVVEMANAKYLELVDRKEETFIGRSLYASLPEVEPVVRPLLSNVLNSGVAFAADGLEVTLNRFGKKEQGFFSLVYQPLQEQDGSIESIIVVATEVTPLINAQQALQRSEAQFRNLVDQSPIAMTIFRGADFIIDIANEAMIKSIWHKEWSEVKDRPLLEVFPELNDQKFPALLHKVYTYGEAYRENEAVAFVDGDKGLKKYYLDFEYAPLKDSDGNIYALMATVSDVTEKVEARQIIKESAERLRLATEGTNLATWDLDLVTGDIIYSPLLAVFFGQDGSTSLTQKTMRAMLHPVDEVEVVQQAYQTALETGTYNYDARIILPAGGMRWVKTNGKIIFDENHKPVRMLGTMRDITEQKKAEQALEENEKKFRLLADSMPQQIWTGDTQGNLNYFSRAAYDYAGITETEMEEKGWLSIVHPDDKDENVSKWIHSVTTGEPFLFEHRFRRYDGEYRWQLSRAIPQLDDDGNIQMWVGTSTDIHDHKMFTDQLEHQVQQRTKELNELNEDLVKSNNELAQFAYVASHDLQEPLRKIQTFASRIMEFENDTLSDRGRDYFKRMQAASSRMQQLIIDLLSYSRVSNADQHFEITDLNILLQNVKEQLRESIEQKRATIKSTPLPGLYIIPYQFEQLFTNLITNALKFARAYEPSVISISSEISAGSSIDHPAADTSNNYWHISVSDNGIGFEPEFSERIFQLFQRLHGREEYAGTGIGLAICKKIVENHRGIITASGAENQGATFNIYLPVKH